MSDIIGRINEELSEVPWNDFVQYPPDHIYNGLTVCNQQEADEKLPIFLQVPGKKFLSIEPMLGKIDLFNCKTLCKWIIPYHSTTEDECMTFCSACPFENGHTGIDAVILGGETGPGARPLHPDWVRSVRDQCAAAGVPFFFKQWGEWAIATDDMLLNIRKEWNSDRKDCCWIDIDGTIKRGSSHGMSEKTFGMIRAGRNKAGRVLDGRTHDELPWNK